MSKSNGGRISADWGAPSASLTIKYNVKHIFSYNKMGRKIPVFIKGGALKNNTDTSHGILVFSHRENPTEFLCKVFWSPHGLKIEGVLKIFHKILVGVQDFCKKFQSETHYFFSIFINNTF